ncbi:hypothetical protein AUTU_31670 [Aureibacter tunicatorum]|nr:hypothetical protein AUTU_31670 [Aureibacter tunicatorum]
MPPQHPIQGIFEPAKTKKDTQAIPWASVKDREEAHTVAVNEGTMLVFDDVQKGKPIYDDSGQVWVKTLLPQGEFAMKLSDLNLDLDDKDSSYISMIRFLRKIWAGLPLNLMNWSKSFQTMCYRIANSYDTPVKPKHSEGYTLSADDVQTCMLELFKTLSLDKITWQHAHHWEVLELTPPQFKEMKLHKKGFYHIKNPNFLAIREAHPFPSKIYLSVKGDYIEPALSFVYHRFFRKTSTIKVSPGAQALKRKESIILYVAEKALLDDILDELGEFFRDHEHWMNDVDMPFTQKIAKGVCWGDDPEVGYLDGRSYMTDLKPNAWEHFLEQTDTSDLLLDEDDEFETMMKTDFDEARDFISKMTSDDIDYNSIMNFVRLYKALYGQDIQDKFDELKAASKFRSKPGHVTSPDIQGAKSSLVSLRAGLLGDVLEEKIPITFEEMYLRFIEKLSQAHIDWMRPHLNARPNKEK